MFIVAQYTSFPYYPSKGSNVALGIIKPTEVTHSLSSHLCTAPRGVVFFEVEQRRKLNEKHSLAQWRATAFLRTFITSNLLAFSSIPLFGYEKSYHLDARREKRE